VLLLATAACALAQDRPSGRLYRLSAGLSTEFTDNRDSTETDKASAWNLVFYGGIDLLVDAPRLHLKFGYQPSVLHRTNPNAFQNDNDLYHQVRLDTDYRVTPRLRLRLNDAFDYTDDPAVDAGGAVIRRDASFRFNRLTAGVQADVTPRSAIDGSIHSVVKRYDDRVFAKAGDEDSLAGSLMSVYRRDPNTRVGGVVAVGRFNYADDSLVGFDRGFGSVEVGAMLMRNFGSQASGRFDAGYKRLTYDLNELGSDSTPYGRVSMVGRIGAQTAVKANVGYTQRDSDAVGFASQDYLDGDLGVEWEALSKRLTFSTTVSYRRGEYDSGDLPPGAAEIREQAGLRTSGTETVKGVAVGATYKLRNLLTVSLSHQYETTDSQLATSFDKNSTRASVSAEF